MAGGYGLTGDSCVAEYFCKIGSIQIKERKKHIKETLVKNGHDLPLDGASKSRPDYVMKQ